MSDFDITCGKCALTITGESRDGVMATFRAHEQAVHNYMTGQQWYDRFKDNLVMAIPTDPDGQVKWALDAARRAAGIQEQS